MKLQVYEGWARNCRKGLVITLKPLRFWIVPQENYSYIPCSITSLWELLRVMWWLIWLIRSSMKCQRIDDLSTFFSVPSHCGSFHQQQGSHFHQDKEERGKNALPPLPISAQDPAISINRALARISDSIIPHMHAFTCRCRHLCLSASP